MTAAQLHTYATRKNKIYSDGERLTRMSRVREVWSLNPGPVKSCTFVNSSISTQVAMLPWRYVAEMGTANSSHVLA